MSEQLQITPLDVDRFEFNRSTTSKFPRWLESWRTRWAAGEPIVVLLANDRSHAVVRYREEPQ